ncbi:MAG: Panacea domain-containing protein [Eubacteriales bacterium]|nr:Panacea domain-containing protein [Eubacteriales bacterium]
MEKTLSVAKLFNDLFKQENGTDMDQMRMHKMMYLVQRESLMYNDEPLFASEFQGWKFGPVLVDVRKEYVTDNMFQNVADDLSEKANELVHSVYQRYKTMSSWKLSSLSHGELSWKCSREGLSAKDNGAVALNLADMRVDAARELLRRKREKVTF